jgi:hypothetical protein
MDGELKFLFAAWCAALAGAGVYLVLMAARW